MKYLPTYAVLLAYVVWVFWLPLFPTQDGPVHLYYTAVAKSLLRHDGAFGPAFTIKHLLPPYSLHSYLLMLFTEALSPVMAEKCLVCICIVVCALGFRSLAARFGASAWATSLLILPFCLHRYLFLGFYNYSLALGVFFFALSVWFDAKLERSTGTAVLFFVLSALLTLTHPLGLAALLLLAGCDVLFRTTQLVWGEKLSLRDAVVALRRRLTVLAVSSLSVLYVARFMLLFHNQPEGGDIASEAYPLTVLQGWKRLLGTGTISPVLSTPLRIILFGIVAAACVAYILDSFMRWRTMRFREADVLFGFAMLLAFAYPMLPYSINGSLAFNVRLTLFCPFLILAAASAIRVKYPAAIAGAGVLVGVASLLIINSRVAPIAREVAQVETIATPYTPATLGLDPTSSRREDLTFDAFLWDSARLARRNKSVLRNGPWLELEITMVGRNEKGEFARTINEDPRNLLIYFDQNPEARAKLLDQDTLVVLSGCGPIARSTGWLLREATPLPGDSVAGCSTLLRYRPAAPQIVKK